MEETFEKLLSHWKCLADSTRSRALVAKLGDHFLRVLFKILCEIAIFKMANHQEPPSCIAQETLLNVMWQPEWEVSLGENGYMYM